MVMKHPLILISIISQYLFFFQKGGIPLPILHNSARHETATLCFFSIILMCFKSPKNPLGSSTWDKQIVQGRTINYHLSFFLVLAQDATALYYIKKTDVGPAGLKDKHNPIEEKNTLKTKGTRGWDTA